MNKQFTNDQQALPGNASNRMSFLDQMNNGQQFNPFKIKFMNKNVFLIAIMLFVSVFFLTGCQQEEIVQPELQNQSSIPGDQLSKEQALKEIKPVVQEFLNAQYEYYIDKDKTPRWFDYMESSVAQTLQQQIDQYRENIEYSSLGGVKAIGYKSEFIYDENRSGMYKSNITQSGNVWTLKNVFDNFQITEKIDGHPDRIENNEWIYNEISLKKENGKWIILYTKEGGLLEEMLPEKDRHYRWFNGRRRDYVSTEETSMRQIQSLASTTTYNKVNAIIYALNNYNNANPNYPNYTSMGGDCTNFVSQCVQAGGWTQITSGTNRWHHTSASNRSPSWTSAASFGTFLSNSNRVSSSSTTSLSNVVGGDIVQLTTNGTAYHSMFITSKRTVKSILRTYVSYRGTGSGKTDIDITNLSSGTFRAWRLKNSYGLA